MEREPQVENSTNDAEKTEMLKKLVKAKSTQERTELFGKMMDTFGVDTVVSLVPALGDTWSSIASSLYLLYEGKKIGLSRWDSLKILWYQTTDVLVWAIPVLWDIADYFFKANKRSAKLFAKHFKKLKKEALKKWVSAEDIAAIEKDNNKFMQAMSKHLEIQKKLQKKDKK